ncbi:unnamed protein product [Diatraea saccharalis]|uniref:Uncharacterized protein n=1 Tax=Diatraea saccharalis TaxID=40085 RepID=A0A9N9W665_9NEOP|nr:unnamed protein product [Diatraea saccharalis]
MESYGYPYAHPFPPMRPPEGDYPDHGDGYGDYYGLSSLNEERASKHKKNTTKYLATKKRQDRIQEILKSDGLGSKKWLFYPRPQATKTQNETQEVTASRDSCDQRVKIDAEFFRKYKRRSKVDSDAPIAKLKRWELIFYKKLGFIQAV